MCYLTMLNVIMQISIFCNCWNKLKQQRSFRCLINFALKHERKKKIFKGNYFLEILG